MCWGGGGGETGLGSGDEAPEGVYECGIETCGTVRA